MAYVETGNASEAYRRAYDAEKAKPETVARTAHDVLLHPKVAARIRELRGDAQNRHRETVDDLLRELEEARTAGLEEPRQVGAAVSATMGKAKLLGLEAPSKLEVENKGGVMLVPVASVADFEKLAAEQQEALQALVRKDGEE